MQRLMKPREGEKQAEVQDKAADTQSPETSDIAAARATLRTEAAPESAPEEAAPVPENKSKEELSKCNDEESTAPGKTQAAKAPKESKMEKRLPPKIWIGGGGTRQASCSPS